MKTTMIFLTMSGLKSEVTLHFTNIRNNGHNTGLSRQAVYGNRFSYMEIQVLLPGGTFNFILEFLVYL